MKSPLKLEESVLFGLRNGAKSSENNGSPLSRADSLGDGNGIDAPHPQG